MSAATIKSYLRPLGIEPTFKDGRLTATAKVNVKQAGGATSTNLSIVNVKFADGTTELAGVDSVTVRDLLQKWVSSTRRPDGPCVQRVQEP